jgi:hypothetical protein
MPPEESSNPPSDPGHEITRAYQAAMAKLAAGDLTAAVRSMLALHEAHPDSEEAFFVEEQLARVRRLWPAEAEKAGLNAAAWTALEARSTARRATRKPAPGDLYVIGVLLAAAAWTLLLAAAPHAAFLGQGPDVAPIFRLVAAVVGLVSAGAAFGLMKMKWEAVNVFIILSPVFMIVTFIGITESPTLVGKAACTVALAAEIGAAWYMSKHSRRFIY